MLKIEKYYEVHVDVYSVTDTIISYYETEEAKTTARRAGVTKLSRRHEIYDVLSKHSQHRQVVLTPKYMPVDPRTQRGGEHILPGTNSRRGDVLVVVHE